MTFRDRIARLNLSILTPLFLIALTACAIMAPKQTPQIVPKETPQTATQLNLIATDNLNPNIAGAPSPIVLILYELTEPALFEEADFNLLFYGDSKALGEEVLARQEFRLAPGEIIRTFRVLDPNTTNLGFVAGYRQIEQKRWRLLTGVRPQTVQEHVVVIGPQALSFPRIPTPGSPSAPANNNEKLSGER